MTISQKNRWALMFLIAATATALSCDSRGPIEPQVVLQLRPESPNLIIGSTIRLEPRTSSGDSISGPIKWSSSAPTIVSVDAVGRITGIATGSSTIRAYAGDSIAETTVTVVGAPSSVTTNVSTTCGLTTGNELYCWGANEAGQTGGGDQQTPILTPRKVAGNLTFTSVSVSTRHACGTTTAGAYCWGDNALGQIGDGTSGNLRLVPTAISGGGSFVSVAVASTLIRTGFLECVELALCIGRSCALSSDGGISCWGENTLIPTRVPLTVQLRTLDLGFAYVCGLDRASVPYCWGDTRFYQTPGALVGGVEPRPIRADLRFQSLSAGHGHSCGLDFDGDVHCWGANGAGELGSPSDQQCLAALGVRAACRAEARKVPTEFKFIALSVGNGTSLRITSPNAHTCAIATTLQVVCWGNNFSGQLGNGSTQSTQTPTPVSGTARFRSVTSGTAHTCGVTVDNDAYCWGFGTSLGSGTGQSSTTPVLVAGGLKFK